jgi:magnesium transporter
MTGEATTVFDLLAEDFLRRYPKDAAADVELLPRDQLKELFSAQTDESAAALLGAMRPEVSAEFLTTADGPRRARWLSVLETSRAAVILSRLDDDVRGEILAGLNPSVAREIDEILSYPPETAGAIMDTRVSRFRVDASAEMATNQLRGLGDTRIGSLHLVDDSGHYLGSVRIQDLALADPDQKLRELITTPPVAVQAIASTTEVVDLLEQHRLPTLPVVDFEGHLIGVIRQNALLSAVEAEASADIQTMVGVSRDERSLSPVGFAVRKRLPWLQINLLTAFLASFVVGLFEDTIARFTALAILLPVVAGQSGNTGAQALAVTMRGLALREVNFRSDATRVAAKEVCVAAINGVAVALVTAAAVLLWSRSPGLAAVIGVSMVISMTIAGLAGAAIPMILTKLGQDPAQASSIVLTTVTDVVGFLSFLGLATLFIRLL